MRIRIKFTREERVKFLGHLDIMRSFQRCFNRACIKMIYSEGFNPHQKMNFAQPLGVGVVSSGDYLDAEVADGQDPDMIMESLNQNLGEGFRVLSCRVLEENAEKCMAAVRAAAYEITVNEGAAPRTDIFLSRDRVLTLKKSKSGEKEADLKPMVYGLDSSESGMTLKLLLAAGSEENLNPVLLMQVLYEQSGLEFERSLFTVKRTDLFAKDFVPLSEYQTL